MHRNAALFPKVIAFLKLDQQAAGSFQFSSSNLTMKAPVKQSPAPTVSSILQFSKMAGLEVVTTGTSTKCSLVIIADPLLPNLRSTFKLGYLFKILVLISSAGFEMSISAWIRRSSVSLGDKMSKFQRSSSGIGSSAPPQSRITVFPFDLASFAQRTLISMGIYFCKRMHLLRVMTSEYSTGSFSLLSYWVLAPPTITITFSPVFSSTQMKAFPVGTSSLTFQPNSTFAAVISFSSICFPSSLPTCPTNSALPASFPTATAWLAPLPPLAIMEDKA